MALNPYYLGYDTGSSTSSTTAFGTYTSSGTIWINDIIRQDIDKAKAKILTQTRDKVAKESGLNVPRGTPLLGVLQDAFDDWAGDVRAAIFN